MDSTNYRFLVDRIVLPNYQRGLGIDEGLKRMVEFSNAQIQADRAYVSSNHNEEEED